MDTHTIAVDKAVVNVVGIHNHNNDDGCSQYHSIHPESINITKNNSTNTTNSDTLWDIIPTNDDHASIDC
jgi:hypothetical protein